MDGAHTDTHGIKQYANLNLHRRLAFNTTPTTLWHLSTGEISRYNNNFIFLFWMTKFSLLLFFTSKMKIEFFLYKFFTAKKWQINKIL